MDRSFRIGVDIGQRVDHSALCLTEDMPEKVVVKLLVKYPLGTPYKMLVETVANMVRSVEKQGDVVSFIVDATGVGAAPTQMFQEAIPEVTVRPFIFSNKTKRELIGKVKVLHSFGRLKFATRRGDEIYNHTLHELIGEMKQLQAKILKDEGDKAEVEIFKTGKHDDLFTALALAVKDVQFDKPTTISFLKDNTFLQTPLDEQVKMPSVVFF